MENKNDKEQLQNTDKKQDEENYMALGMCFGASIGILLGLTIFKDVGLGLCFGPGIGMCIGLAIKKK